MMTAIARLFSEGCRTLWPASTLSAACWGPRMAGAGE
jgi:hypothetical protein